MRSRLAFPRFALRFRVSLWRFRVFALHFRVFALRSRVLALRFRVSLWRLCTQKNLRNTVPQVSVSLVVREFRFSREG